MILKTHLETPSPLNLRMGDFILILSRGLFEMSMINNLMHKVMQARPHRVAGVAIQMQSAVEKRRGHSAALITGGSG